MPHDKEHDAGNTVANIYWRDEILQLMYWMSGEGFGQEFAIDDLGKFLNAGDSVLETNLAEMVDTGLLERVGDDKYALTTDGKKEGGRRFADEFEEMLKPGHFECDEPDCDCHDPDSVTGVCKHLLDNVEAKHSLLN